MTDLAEPPVYAPPAKQRRRIPRSTIAYGALLLLAAGAGTFASFSASTSNGSTFATGALVLSNQVDTGTVCLSIGNDANTDDNQNDCDQLFSTAVRKPGDSATVNVTLENDGTIAASALRVHRSAACATANRGSETYHGGGDLCGSLQLTVQEFASAALRTANDPTGGSCVYGGNEGAGNLCTFSATRTVGTFATSYPDATTSLDTGPMASQAFRYFQVGVKLDSAAGNSAQGREATFGLTWMIEQ